VRVGVALEAQAGAGAVPPLDRATPAATEGAGSSARVSARAPSSPSRPAASPPLEGIFRDAFERDALGSDYAPTSTAWRLEGGQVCGSGAHNHPLWLRRRLPTNARIEFRARSDSADGDIKVEVWGDGVSYARGATYDDATSYLAILGGWQNRRHVLARRDEHGADRIALTVDPTATALPTAPVVPHRTYGFVIERVDGRTVRWLVDGVEVAALTDPTPLAGPGHDHFGFNDWETEVCFDDLVIRPL
jgi:hypothetical protein